MPDRDLVEWVTDQLLLLQVSRIASEITNLHRTKMQKIIFLSQRNLWGSGTSGFDYIFFRYKLGPFSDELKEDMDHLIKAGLLHYTERTGYILKSKGRQLLEQFSGILKNNHKMVEIIEKHIRAVMDTEIQMLLETIYSQPNPIRSEMTIGNTPETHYLLTRETRPKNLIPFAISEIEAESLELLLDPELVQLMNEAEYSVKNEPLIPWNGQ